MADDYQIERTRFNEIAQELRRPGAVCFLERAINTMEPGEVDGEQVWVAVPEGQIKFRVRVGVDGTVLSTDVLESGFEDEHMETCLAEAFSKQRFVESRSWRLVYAAGMVLGAFVVAALAGAGPATSVPWPQLLIGGVVAGFGARLANGCTSGHGICGLASLQLPSLLAVLTFLATAFLTANAVRSLGAQP